MRWAGYVLLGVTMMVAACSPGGELPAPVVSSVSLSDARMSALARLDEMRYADVAPFRKQVEGAESAATIEAVMVAAEAEDAEAKQRYWACAGSSVDVLRGSSWERVVAHDGSFVTSTVRLTLREDGSALLEVSDGNKDELVNHSVKKDVPVVERVDQVSAWDSDAEQLIAEQRWIGRRSSSSWWGPKACIFPFNLTLTVDGSPETVYSELQLSPQKTTLSIFDSIFILVEEKG